MNPIFMGGGAPSWHMINLYGSRNSMQDFRNQPLRSATSPIEIWVSLMKLFLVNRTKRGDGSGRHEKPASALRLHFARVLGFAVTVLIIGAGVGFCQDLPSAGVSSTELLQFLNQTIDWYRQMDRQRQMATEPDQVLLVNENQQITNEVAWLAFDFARAEAESVEKQASMTQTADQGSNSSRYQSLRRLSDRLDKKVRESRGEVESLRQKLATATGRQRNALQSQIAASESELDLALARKEALHSMVEFVGGTSANGLGATGLRQKIEALARSIPAAMSKPSNKPQDSSSQEQPYAASVASTWKPEPASVWGLAADLFVLSKRNKALADAIQQTDSLAQSTKTLRSPLVNRLKEMSRYGDELAKQTDLADQTELAQAKKKFDMLTSQFKQTSAAVLPLSKIGILLDLYKRNLTNWQSTVKNRYATELRNLLLRLILLFVILAAIIGGAELWRRTIFRYVRDVRRRYQFLLLRKIVLWCVMAIVLIFSFSNELGSVATFAGLMTAGIAVALQSVILSIAGYFFLIGKFGIKVGDRVQVAGVSGEVVDIGLVRFHLLELVSGGGKTPSGRVVAFSNSIVFQPTAGLFKQIPGTNFVWHEIALTLSSDSDYGSAQERLLEAVEAVFSEYREEMERQYRHMEKTLSASPMAALRPISRFRLTQSSLEVVIRYPVDLMHSTEIDDLMTRELLKAIDREPRLKLLGSETPGIKPVTNLSTSE
jgi:small-conductance mechanosensitive channel